MERGARKRGGARQQGRSGKSAASGADSSGLGQGRAEKRDSAVSIPEQQASGSLDNMASRCADFSKLPFEVLVTIFEKVNKMTGNQVVLCAEVCKDWHSAVASALTHVRLIEVKADARTYTSPEETTLDVVKAYPNLRELCVEQTVAGRRGWGATFAALGKSCTNLQHLTMLNIYPSQASSWHPKRVAKLVASDMQALAPCLARLRSFHLGGNLSYIPLPSFAHFSALETLTLDLVKVPGAPPLGLYPLPSLRHLTIINAYPLDTVFDNTTNLETLVLKHAPVNHLQVLVSLSHLQSLEIYRSWPLRGDGVLPHLPSLRQLNLENVRPICFSLNPQITSLTFSSSRHQIPYQMPCLHPQTAALYSGLTHLQTTIKDTREIRTLSLLPSLVRADLTLGNPGIVEPSLTEPFELPSSLEITLEVLGYVYHFAELAALRPIHIRCRLGLSPVIKDLGWLPLVHRLELPLRDELPPHILSQLSGLKYLSLRHHLVEFHPSASLPNLQEMICTNIMSPLDPLTHLTSLVSLTLRECFLRAEAFSELPSSLQDLSITDFRALKALPPLANLGALKRLKLSHCAALELVPPLGGLTSLQSLAVSYCPLVLDLPQVAELRQLRVLDVSGSLHLNPSHSRSVAAVGRAVHVIWLM